MSSNDRVYYLLIGIPSINNATVFLNNNDVFSHPKINEYNSKV